MSEKTKTLFRTAYGGRERKTIPTGTGIENEYSYVVDNYGRRVIEKTGERNLYEEIQLHHEETKIENILNRALAGDTSGLAANGTYMDTTLMPNNLIEARKQMQMLENTWAGIPQEIKAKYNNNVEEFIGAAGSDAWMVDMGLMQSGDKNPVQTVEQPKEGNQAQAFGQVEKPGEGVTPNEP